MCVHPILIKDNDYSEFEKFLVKTGYKKILLVCGHSIEYLKINGVINDIEQKNDLKLIRFSELHSNPEYDSVVRGVEIYKEERCEAILAIGGGSAMDVAKCIKLFCYMKADQNYLVQKIVPNDIELFAVPTTSGTGSEATRFSVIYYNGEKQSISDYSCVPTMVFLDASTLDSIPEYQRKVTMLDALCHAIESFWSVNSTFESRRYSQIAIHTILKNMDAYLKNESDGNLAMLEASNTAGKAINITQTTAGHAMCYKLTSLYGLSHGHAVALCVSQIWPYMIKNIEKCIDPRGKEYLKNVFSEIAKAFGVSKDMDAVVLLHSILNKFDLEIPHASDADFDILIESVNTERLKNNPVQFDKETIGRLYHDIIRE